MNWENYDERAGQRNCRRDVAIADQDQLAIPRHANVDCHKYRQQQQRKREVEQEVRESGN